MNMREHKKAVRQRTVDETICANRRCEFYGQPVVQGVCHTSDGEIADLAKMDKYEAELTAELKQMKRREGKDYIRALEAHYLCARMNWTGTLDECIRLRRDNAILKDRTARKDSK